MFRSSLAILCIGSLVLVTACRSSNGNNNPGADLTAGSHDLSVKGDGGGGGGADMTTFDTYTATTPHDIDTGNTQINSTVKLVGVVATSEVYFFKAMKGTVCQYEVWVQDASCNSRSAAPCGIVVVDPNTYAFNSSGKCDYADQSMSLLKNVKIGDNMDMFGIVDTFQDPDTNHTAPVGAAKVVQHSVKVQMFTKTSSTATVTPIELTSDADVTAFANQNSPPGLGYFLFEGTLITLAPASGKLTITAVPDFKNTFDNRAGLGATLNNTKDVSLGTDFSGIYQSGDGGSKTFPAIGTQFTSITGVVDNIFGGAVQPRFADDWHP